MQYRRLGATGLKVSEITYGSWLTFGSQVELDAAQEIVKRAFDLGINSFDTADVYKRGEAETLLGQILPKRRRSEYVLATKAFWPMSDHPTDRGLSRKHLFDSVESSLGKPNSIAARYFWTRQMLKPPFVKPIRQEWTLFLRIHA